MRERDDNFYLEEPEKSVNKEASVAGLDSRQGTDRR